MTYPAVNDPNITSGFTFNKRSVSLAALLRRPPAFAGAERAVRSSLQYITQSFVNNTWNFQRFWLKTNVLEKARIRKYMDVNDVINLSPQKNGNTILTSLIFLSNQLWNLMSLCQGNLKKNKWGRGVLPSTHTTNMGCSLCCQVGRKSLLCVPPGRFQWSLAPKGKKARVVKKNSWLLGPLIELGKVQNSFRQVDMKSFNFKCLVIIIVVCLCSYVCVSYYPVIF